MTTPELHDRRGWPIREACWVYVDQPSTLLPGRAIHYRGNVEGFDEDTHGPIVIVRTPKGAQHLARLQHVEVRPKPRKQRVREVDDARRTLAVRRRRGARA